MCFFALFDSSASAILLDTITFIVNSGSSGWIITVG